MKEQSEKTVINRTIHPTTEEFTINTELYETLYNLLIKSKNREIRISPKFMDVDKMTVNLEITTEETIDFYKTTTIDQSVYKAQLNRTGDQ